MSGTITRTEVCYRNVPIQQRMDNTLLALRVALEGAIRGGGHALRCFFFITMHRIHIYSGDVMLEQLPRFGRQHFAECDGDGILIAVNEQRAADGSRIAAIHIERNGEPSTRLTAPIRDCAIGEWSAVHTTTRYLEQPSLH